MLELVNPFVGTGGVGFGFGGSYPGAGRPLGLVKVSPDTATATNNAPGFSHTGGYNYDDDYIRGFSHMHMQGVGIAAYGALALMPADGFEDDDITAGGHLQRFAHDDERAGAGWYEVGLPDLGAQVRLSATEHTALHEYTFSGASEPTVLIDLAHVIGNGTVPGGKITVSEGGALVEGWLVMDGEMGAAYPLFFSIRFEQAPTGWGTWANDRITVGGLAERIDVPETYTEGDSPPLGAWVSFAGEETVRARVAVSNVDLEGARNNYAVEHSGFDYEADKVAAQNAWAAMMAPIRAWGGDERDRALLATSVFKAVQMPTLYSDADGRYRAFDGETKQAHWGPFYTDFSLWDTYRTTHPLLVLLWKEQTADMMDSLAAMARDGGSIPRWPLGNSDGGVMLGTPANIVFAEAYLKGVTDFDIDTLRDTALDIADGTLIPAYGGRPDVRTYEAYQYHPTEDMSRTVAWTQEVAVSDHILGRLENEIGDPDVGAALIERGTWWKNHFNPETGFFHERLMDGSFVPIDDEAIWDEAYAEGNARQYRWLVPHDPEGLFAVFGGDEITLDYLTGFFEGRAEELEEIGEIGVPSSWYWHGNEPDIHAPWLFALVGRPDLTRQWVGWVLDNEYDNTPGGVDGNDDAGTLAAWYVFAAAGMYPLNGTDRYVLGDPRFDLIELDVGAPGDAPFRIERIGDDEIVEVLLDGTPLPEGTYEIDHADIAPGATLSFIGADAR
jgi:predicted alpha-1,2-mannosidase